MNIIEACQRPDLFGPWFRVKKHWANWFVFLSVVFNIPLTPEQLAVFQKYTSREIPPQDVLREIVLIIGRRGGKSFILALIGVYLACFRSYRQFLQPGEKATVRIMAADRRQARVIMRYARGMLTGIAVLKRMIERETAEGFELNNSVVIEIGTASLKTTRGYAFAAILADECAFWRTDDDAAEPDFEVLNAVRPGMASIPGSMLLVASSPYAKRGVLYKAFLDHYGKTFSSTLVWKAPTSAMNPTIDLKVIADAYEADSSAADAEYGGNFRDDLEPYVSIEAVQGLVSSNVTVRAPLAGVKYYAFTDPAGGSGSDSMTLAIAHKQDDMVITDRIEERKPKFSPHAVVNEFCDILDDYGIDIVWGDRWGGEFAREPFRANGIEYGICTAPRTELYLELLPQINSGLIDLIANPKLVNQLASLERSTTGKGNIDHRPGAHDDVSNAVAGVSWLINLQPRVPEAQWLAGNSSSREKSAADPFRDAYLARINQ